MAYIYGPTAQSLKPTAPSQVSVFTANGTTPATLSSPVTLDAVGRVSFAVTTAGNYVVKVQVGTRVSRDTVYLGPDAGAGSGASSADLDTRIAALAAVARTGNYADLNAKPVIPTAPGDIGAQPAGSYATSQNITTAIQNLPAVARSGAYSDLSGKPTIPSTPQAIGAQPAGSYASTQDVSTAISGLPAAARSGSYTDLTNKPTIPSTAAAVGADPAGSAAAVSAKTLSGPAAVLSTTGTLTAGVSNAVDSSAGSLTATLPTPSVVGQLLSVERIDTSASNTITVSGTIRGNAATITLQPTGTAGEGLLFVAESLTSWRPIAGHKPTSWLDSRYLTQTSASSVLIDTADLPTYTGTASSGVSTKASPSDHVHPRADWQPRDHNLITWSFDAGLPTLGSALASAGVMYLQRLHVPVATTVTNIIVYVSTQGATLTANQCGSALYNSARSLLGQTADTSGTWGSTGLKTMPLTTPVVVPAGDYYAAMWFNGTTAPQFMRSAGNAALVNVGLTASFARSAISGTGVTTTAPTTAPSLASGSVNWWVALS